MLRHPCLVAAGIAAGVLAAPPASALLVLAPSGGPTYAFTDSDGLGGAADIDVPPHTLSFDIVYDSLGGTDLTGGTAFLPPGAPSGPPVAWGLRIEQNDPLEILRDGLLTASFTLDPLGTGLIFPLAGVPDASGPSFLEQTYLVGPSVIPSGTVIASFSVTASLLGPAPDDELDDLLLFGISALSFGAPTTVWDPVMGMGVPGGAVPFDVHGPRIVPTPLGAFLLGSALALFAWAGRALRT